MKRTSTMHWIEGLIMEIGSTLTAQHLSWLLQD